MNNPAVLSARRLGERLGMAIHQSPLRFKILRLMARTGFGGSAEDWLVAVANERGWRVVFPAVPIPIHPPTPEEFSDEELAAGLCLLQSLDRPPLLRLAAQGISRGRLNMPRLLRLAEMERLTPILRAIGEQALRVEPRHPVWLAVMTALPSGPALREPLVHWTRLAEPIMLPGRPNPTGWKLVA